jgi:hypothetical protein
MNLSLSQIEGSPRFFASEYFYDFRIKNNFCAESEIVSEIKIFRRFASMNKWKRNREISRNLSVLLCPTCIDKLSYSILLLA